MAPLLPPLAWLPNVTGSMSRALGCSVSYVVQPTVNPLIYTIRFSFGERQEPKYRAMLWNVVQMYAARNEALPQSVSFEEQEMRVTMGVKRRLGTPRKADAWA